MQLIDPGVEAPYLPIKPEMIPYTFRIQLTDRTYAFTIRYNPSGAFFTADLVSASDEVLAFGDVIRYGRPLFGSIEDERFPLPVIIPHALNWDSENSVTPKNFGQSVKLYMHERRLLGHGQLDTLSHTADRPL